VAVGGSPLVEPIELNDLVPLLACGQLNDVVGFRREITVSVSRRGIVHDDVAVLGAAGRQHEVIVLEA